MHILLLLQPRAHIKIVDDMQASSNNGGLWATHRNALQYETHMRNNTVHRFAAGVTCEPYGYTTETPAHLCADVLLVRFRGSPIEPQHFIVGIDFCSELVPQERSTAKHNGTAALICGNRVRLFNTYGGIVESEEQFTQDSLADCQT